LREGITALIPPHVKHRFVNTADKPLMMLMWEEFPDAKPRNDLIVRDSRVLPFLVSRGHWSYASKILFTSVDGLSPHDGFSVAYMTPMTIGDPHAHPPHHEEIWIKLPPAEKAYLFLGSEVQPMPANVAFLAPVTGQTTHSILNLSDKVEGWIGTNHWPG
jgi:mannose-6-phosphate isomerase-like protein (cupin superfamily)